MKTMALKSPLELSTRYAARVAIEDALKEIPSLQDTFSLVDPYLPSFHDDLENLLTKNLKPYWPTVQKKVNIKSKDMALRHAWAVATKEPVQLACLYRSAISNDDLAIRDLATHLFQNTKHYISGNLLAEQLISPAKVIPDLDVIKFLKPGMKARYRLAAALASGESLGSSISSIPNISGATDYIQKRELTRFLEEAKKINFHIKPFLTVDFILKTKEEQKLILSSQNFIDQLLPNEIKKLKNISLWLEEKISYRKACIVKITKLSAALKIRKFKESENYILELNSDALVKKILSLSLNNELFLKQGKKFKELSQDKTITNKWQNLSDEHYCHLKKLLPKHSLPAWWTWTSSKIADEIANYNLKLDIFNSLEIDLLRNSWSIADNIKIISAGFHLIIPANNKVWSKLSYEELFLVCSKRPDFNDILKTKLDENPSPNELLEYLANKKNLEYTSQIQQIITNKFSLGEALSSKIGSVEWKQIGGWNIHATSRLNDIYKACTLQKSGQEMAPDFKETAINGLITFPVKKKNNILNRDSLVKSSFEVTRDLVLEKKLDITDIVDAAPTDWLTDFLNHLVDYPKLLYKAQINSPPNLAKSIFLLRLKNSPINGKKLLSLFLEGVDNRYPIDWIPKWSNLATDKNVVDANSVAALYIVLRNNLKKLKRILHKVPDEIADAGFEIAIQSLKGRDLTTLELARVLGFDIAPHLSAVISLCDYKSETGKRLDKIYLKWTLPKKSGGVRIISAPPPSLKIVQRRILDKLLTPLGFHDCAYGFAKGRSIKDNASVHVGNPIVANADITNCFPNVRWPLVLGAIRRDLGEKLSKPAISILVDICTSEGGLPIGAPTSPALLNRVLYKSDQILEAESKKRSCNYSRYADDLTFSGDYGAIKMLGVSKGVLGRIGLVLDPKKTNIFRKGRRQAVTGLVVNQQVSVARRIRRRLRAAVHHA